MNNDIIIVDDDKDYLQSLCDLVGIYNPLFIGRLNPLGFELPDNAIEHLQQRGEEAIGYFIDMKPIGGLNEDRIKNLSKTELILLDLPERIYNYLKEKRVIDVKNFYFITAMLSQHDYDVVERTGATVLLKEDIRTIKQAVSAIVDRTYRNRWDDIE
ncbi:hypothetical protein HYT57_03610 [Candidatus Woesearchaeota archaeon]|nr:hypothetical protein [Candidatus Woesearchaeota archaeon]